MHSNSLAWSLGLSLLGMLGVCGASARLGAQCSTQWLPGPGTPGTDGSVAAATVWDRDGSGPLPPVVVIGGSFALAGSVVANNIAAYDPVSGAWSPLGSGVAGLVRALAVLPSGELVAAGSFASAGGVSASNIAQWDGTTWRPLGSGTAGATSADVWCLTVLDNGNLIAGGSFDAAGGVPAARIAGWNGNSWFQLGSGMTSSLAATVYALTALPGGRCVAGGSFTAAGGVPANSIAAWNGISWSPLGSGLGSIYFYINALTTLPNGDVVAGGYFTWAGSTPAHYIARWDGTTWWPLGSGMSGGIYSPPWVLALATLANGDIVAGGQFSIAGGVTANRIARWNGTSWSALGTGVGSSYSAVTALTTLPNGSIFAGGSFQTAGGVIATSFAQWNGSWTATASGTNGGVTALTTLANGDVIAGGWFTMVGGVLASSVARWNGVLWSPLGSGLVGVVRALALLNGDVIAGGWFTIPGSPNHTGIARWDGTAWSVFGSGTDGIVDAMTRMPNGDLVVGGGFSTAGGVTTGNIARWNGANWSAVGTGMNGGVFALTVLPNGDLVAGGEFTRASGASVNRVARWDGNNWLPLGAGLDDDVLALQALANGDLIVGGQFGNAGTVSTVGIARWDGAMWSSLGSGMDGEVWAISTLPNHDLLVGGYFLMAGGAPANNVARWNGSSWSAVGAGANDVVYAWAALPNGDLVAGGRFTTAGGLASAYFGRLTTTCPASAATYGSGCSGAGGPNVLTAISLPWIGSTCQSIATGMPANGLAVGIRGLSAQSLPLAPLPTYPGCTLLTSPDLLDVYLPSGGQVAILLPIPAAIAIVGRTLHQQVAGVEVAGAGGISAFTTTNALTLNIGHY